MNYLTTTAFLEKSQKSLLIDVRSPSEYQQGHIPGAVNIPIFDDDERHKVGLAFNEEGKKHAVKLGLEMVGPRMRALVEEAESQAEGRPLCLYCWRGGMRSASMAWLFETSGLTASVLTKGYKSYRNLLNNLFDRKLVLLGGETGSGKTKVLQALQKLGQPVIDLEHLANHRGSAFGAIGLPEQPTTEHFQNLLINEFWKLQHIDVIVLEDESSSIGRVGLPTQLWQVMKQSPIIKLDIPRGARVQQLVEDYGSLDVQQLEEGIRKIQKKLGGKTTSDAINELKSGKVDLVAEMMLRYYDKAYSFLLERKQSNITRVLSYPECNPERIAADILPVLQKV